MARQRDKSKKVYSAISDEELAIIIASDFERAPYEFKGGVDSSATDVSDSESFLHNTSGKGIDPMIKWL